MKVSASEVLGVTKREKNGQGNSFHYKLDSAISF